MKQIILFLMVLFAFVNSGCDVIDDGDRLIPRTDVVNEDKPVKRVLLLDFTDQNCKNCLNATAEIQKLKEYFNDTLVAVSIHATPLPFPLRTKEGNEYEAHFQADDHPTGIVDGGNNGKFLSHDPQVWGGFILDRLKTEPVVDIDFAASYDPETKDLNVKVLLTGYKNLSNAKLLLWIIENNIQDWQLMLDGSINREYIHNHVFRSSINGTWGEAFSIEAKEEKSFDYSYSVNAKWKPEDLAIVGYVYDPNTDEVFDVLEIKL